MKVKKIKVKIVGLKPLLFNKFCGIKDEETPTVKKFDLDEDNNLVIFSTRLYNFLFDVGDTAGNRNTYGAIKMFTGRKHKELVIKGNAYIGIGPQMIYITRDDKKIKFDEFGKNGIIELEEKTGKGKPQNIKRPMIETPWEAEFEIDLIPNDFIGFEDLKGWFEKGGIEVGLGAWRPRYGQFYVKEFKEIK